MHLNLVRTKNSIYHFHSEVVSYILAYSYSTQIVITYYHKTIFINANT